MEHYSDLYGRENTISDATMEAVERLPVIEELDETPSLGELSKAIDSLYPQAKHQGWMESQQKSSRVQRHHSLNTSTHCSVSAGRKGTFPRTCEAVTSSACARTKEIAVTAITTGESPC